MFEKINRIYKRLKKLRLAQKTVATEKATTPVGRVSSKKACARNKFNFQKLNSRNKKLNKYLISVSGERNTNGRRQRTKGD